MRWLMASLLSFSILLADDDETVEPATSFVEEVMQPLGMPIVSVFHQVRESPFLNMARAEASGLEAVGDFFLAPSRYLFGGKTINKQYETSTSFDYGNYDWLKTTCSLVVLPVTEIVGCTLKAAAFLFARTRKNYKAIYNQSRDATTISYIDKYRAQGIEVFHTSEIAPCQQLARPSVLPEKHILELEALKEICSLFEQHHIIYWLDCGTCLGAYRYGGMIPWDNDIDISILSLDHDNVKKLLGSLDHDQYQIQDWSSYRYPKTFMKLYIKKTKTLIDIYHYNLDKEARTVNYFYSYIDSFFPESWKKCELYLTKPIPYEIVFPLKKTVFDGIETWVPYQTEAYLQRKYGQNLSPTMVWDEKNQAYLKVKDHPYWTIYDVK